MSLANVQLKTQQLLSTGVWDLVSRGLDPKIYILTTLVFQPEFSTIRFNDTFMYTSIQRFIIMYIFMNIITFCI